MGWREFLRGGRTWGQAARAQTIAQERAREDRRRRRSAGWRGYADREGPLRAGEVTDEMITEMRRAGFTTRQSILAQLGDIAPGDRRKIESRIRRQTGG